LRKRGDRGGGGSTANQHKGGSGAKRRRFSKQTFLEKVALHENWWGFSEGGIASPGKREGKVQDRGRLIPRLWEGKNP